MMIVTLDIRVGETDVPADLYIALELAGIFYFMPEFSQDLTILVSWTFPADLVLLDLMLMEIKFPDIEYPEMNGTWHGIVVKQGTMGLLDYSGVDFLLH